MNDPDAGGEFTQPSSSLHLAGGYCMRFQVRVARTHFDETLTEFQKTRSRSDILMFVHDAQLKEAF